MGGGKIGKSTLPRKLSPQAEGLLGYLLTLADGGGIVELTRGELAAARSVSIPTISRALRELREAGELVLVKEGGGRGRPSRYQITRLARGTLSPARGCGGSHRLSSGASTGKRNAKQCRREPVPEPVLDPETARESAAQLGRALVAGAEGLLQGAAEVWCQLPAWQRTVLAGLPLCAVAAWLGKRGGGGLWMGIGGGVGLLTAATLALLVPEEKVNNSQTIAPSSPEAGEAGLYPRSQTGLCLPLCREAGTISRGPF